MASNLYPFYLYTLVISSTVDQILADLLAGKITRDEAAERIRSVMSAEQSQT